MKIVVIGGSGRIGSQVVSKLSQLGHEAIAASPSSGVDTLTGEGLDQVLQGADITVDVANSPSFEDNAVMNFFKTSTGNVLKAALKAGVKKHVALSIVGVERMPDNGYFRAKVAQETLIRNSGIPFTIVHATQFMEFIGGIADASMINGECHLSTFPFQPIAAADVASLLTDIVLEPAKNGVVEIGGPEKVAMSELIGKYLQLVGDKRPIVAGPDEIYWGEKIDNNTLVTSEGARLGTIDFKTWFSQQPVKA